MKDIFINEYIIWSYIMWGIFCKLINVLVKYFFYECIYG